MPNLNESLARWRNPETFIVECLIDPTNNRPFDLYPEERQFLAEALKITPGGKMAYTESLFSGGKKSGKTSLAAMIVIYTAVVLAGANGEVYLLANDLEQSSSRVFRSVVQILQASPLLRDSVDVTANKVTFRSTGTFVQAVANDYEGFSGANPTLNVYDELAYYTSESSRRLWDEGVPSPARQISFRLSVSTAGFDGEPSPLRDLYDRAMKDGIEIAPDLRRDGNFLCYWTHACRAPWQSAEWIAEMQRTLRPSQFARLIRNEWTSAESTFIELAQWDACTDPALQPILAKSNLSVWAGLDLGLKHDATALLAVCWEDGRIRVVEHRIFVPAGDGTALDIEATAESAVLSLKNRFALRAVFFDPWQGIGLAQRLTRQGVAMTEHPQNVANLSVMAGNLLELIKNRQLVCYPSDELRQAVSKTIAIEGSRGWRLGKAKQSDRVDPIIALAMACYAATLSGRPEPYRYIPAPPAPRLLHGSDLGPGLFGAAPDRSIMTGEQVAAAEDRAELMARARMGRRGPTPLRWLNGAGGRSGRGW
ncbi:MAG: terminase TerL endonuclease subunit [Candidatus Binataceae bacterium]